MFVDIKVYTLACFFLRSDPVPWAPNGCMARRQDPNMLRPPPTLSLPSVVLHYAISVEVTEEFCPRWAQDLRAQSRLFTGTLQTHQIQKEPLFDRRSPWKLAQTTRPKFSESLCPESYPSPADARGAAKTGVLALNTFSGGPSDWLESNRAAILVGHSRMNANKPVGILKTAFLRD